MVGHAGLLSDPEGTIAACAAHLGLTPDPAALQAFATGHLRVFHVMAGIDSTASRAGIPRDRGQSFHGIVGRFDRQSNGIGFRW